MLIETAILFEEVSDVFIFSADRSKIFDIKGFSVRLYMDLSEVILYVVHVEEFLGIIQTLVSLTDRTLLLRTFPVLLYAMLLL